MPTSPLKFDKVKDEASNIHPWSLAVTQKKV